MSHPHDEADHQPIRSAISRIVEFAGKNGQLVWAPRGVPEKFLDVRIGFWPIFLGLAGNNIDRKKGIWGALKQRQMLIDKIENLSAMLTVTNAGADDDFVDRRQIKCPKVTNLNQRCLASSHSA